MRCRVSENVTSQYANVFPPNISHIEAMNLLEKAERHLQRKLGTNRRLLDILPDSFRACGIAGLVPLSRDFTLEIAPKYFVGDNGDWLDTLGLLAALSSHGSLFLQELTTAYTVRGSIVEMAGHVLLTLAHNVIRKPIRQYVRHTFWDAVPDGEVHYDSACEQFSSGWEQSVTRFDRHNEYNAIISAAIRAVQSMTVNRSLRERLGKTAEVLGPPCTRIRRFPRIPSHNREWSLVYELSCDILRGHTITCQDGSVSAPSFVVETWQLWEWLVSLGLGRALGKECTVKRHKLFHFGSRWNEGKYRNMQCNPDVSVYSTLSSNLLFLADAKYKVVDPCNITVDRADLYEAYAFCKSAQANSIVLIFPADSTIKVSGSSVCYRLDDIAVYPVAIPAYNVSRSDFLARFSDAILSAVAVLSDTSTQ